MSLLVWGSFLLVGQNLGRTLGRWQSEARLIVYLTPGTSEVGASEIEDRIRAAPWVKDVRSVSAADAKQMFRDAFPSLEDLMEGWSESPLPASLEVSMHAAPIDQEQVGRWMEELRAEPMVDMVDDDRDWIGQLEVLSAMARNIGLVVGLVLLGAATFTIASVVRLNAYLYQDEISIMRLVGATEFLIRGPFFFEGMLEGLMGGLLASGGLYLAHTGLLSGLDSDGVLVDLLLRQFLSWPQLALLVAFGGLAGIVGVALSLKGEALSPEEG